MRNIFFSKSYQECVYLSATTSPDQSSCRFDLMIPDLTEDQVCYFALKVFHGKMQDLWQKIGLMSGMINSVLNPIVYAFWYSQFRLRITQTWKNFFTNVICMPVTDVRSRSSAPLHRCLCRPKCNELEI